MGADGRLADRQQGGDFRRVLPPGQVIKDFSLPLGEGEQRILAPCLAHHGLGIRIAANGAGHPLYLVVQQYRGLPAGGYPLPYYWQYFGRLAAGSRKSMLRALIRGGVPVLNRAI